MPPLITGPAPNTLSAVSLVPIGPVNPSPADWRDQILYFLLPDRFSDGAEATRPLFSGNPAAHPPASISAWMSGGVVFQGGTIAGIQSKLPYLKGLGVTALWIGPVFKQRKDLQTYHGYGIQNFLDVDPRFGTRQDLRSLVDAAHALGLYVILDIIYNHSGNNFFYADEAGGPVETRPYRFEPAYKRSHWRSSTGAPITAIAGPDDGVWPTEFQVDRFYTLAGSIRDGHFDPEPWEHRLDPRTEFRRGDFFSLKDLRTQERKPFVQDADASAVLGALIKLYQYWIALTDCDGFRVDTVKHVSFEASRNFCGAIHEYAESIGKENFLVLGEVAGGAEITRDYLEVFGRNLDAALDLGGPMDVLTQTMKGFGDPRTFFSQFGGHDALGTHREVGRYHVSVLDDHDMISRNPKRRFCAGGGVSAQQVAHVTGMQLTTLGIPCIYYGTEQAFDGSETRHDATVQPLENQRPPHADRYVREAMFGRVFGAFQTSGCHFFDPNHPTYLRIAAIARVVTRTDSIGMALRRGRQYPRDVAFNGTYLPPQQGELVAWSRVLFQREVVVAVNTNGAAKRGGFVTVDRGLHPPGSTLNVLYRGDWTNAELLTPPSDPPRSVTDDNGRSVVRVDLPPAGMIILA
jgi:glycosidase